MAAANDIPQWKKDLISRRRNQNKRQHDDGKPAPTAAAFTQHPAHRHRQTASDNLRVDTRLSPPGCRDPTGGDMVQQKPWKEESSSSSSSEEEDLRYGPGIVNRLKNRYLSLALRENETRPSILPLRKAASLENLLEGDGDGAAERGRYEKKANGRGADKGRNPVRSTETMKRSRSTETISRGVDHTYVTDARPKSLHEETLISKEGSVDTARTFSRPNKPKRIAPIMDEREKPPADVVKQTKRLFEGRPEQRTRPPYATGEVAAKVATYKSIIVQTKKKPAVKAKPALPPRKMGHSIQLPPWVEPKQTEASPIPDVSKTDLKNSSLTETPDLIVHSSPSIASPTFRIETTRTFLKEELENYYPHDVPDASAKPPPTQPLHIEINGHEPPSKKLPRILDGPSQRSESVIKSTNPSKPALTVREIEKNLINSAKTLEVKGVCESANRVVQVPKVKRPPRVQQEQNSIVFKFTDRKEIPDYVGNDGRTATQKVALPKAGEGGIILLPGASLDESFTEDDEDWLKSLEGPPSPCDVTFVNDNVLIDGRSSMSQKSKMRQKMKISFVEANPEIFEYPSETSLMDDSIPPSSNGSSVGHNVPPLTGSSLANYTPKTGVAAEDFQLGVTRAAPVAALRSEVEERTVLEEVEQPMLFSAGTNSDILF